ncbi:fibronectin type III domain-containing protein [Chryseobacterium zhengzhouense]|uniref:Fibronectin type III domain-containing protein n=1 Tax=Chryseobacterium zhengzhouense TaxID=1636086 RepID=A0ABW2LTB4_9FLAO
MKNNYIGLLRRNDSTGNPEKGTFGRFSSIRTKKTGGWLTGLFAAASLLLSSSNAFAQTNISAYSFSKSIGATYTPITGGTKVFPSGTNTSYDNDISAAITLPTPFTYGGVTVNSVYISGNGFITFGAAPSGTSYSPLSTLGSTTGAIAAFGQDGASSTATGAVPEVRYQDLGTEFVVQYQDHANYNNRTTERLNFQIRLNYLTGAINIVYGDCTNPGTSTTGTTPQVGIRGNSTTYATNVNPLMIGNVPTGSTCDWSKAVTGNAETSTMLFSGTANVNVKIPNGLQYTWTPSTQLPVRTFTATTAVTNVGATLNWTAPTGATAYNIQYRALGTCDWTNFSGNPVSTTTATLTGLTQNTTYQVQVQALNGTVQSTYSHIPNLAGTGNGYATAGSFTTAYNCASTVTGLTSSALAPNSATISWTASTTAPGSGYEYYYSTSSTAPTVTTTPSGSVGAGIVTANLSGLTPSTQYYYWVRGNCNGTDKGVWSSSANFTTLGLCPTVSSPSANATGVSLNPTITWAVINGATGYKIKVGTTSGANNIVDADVAGGSSNSYPITATLNNATTYYYSVTAYTATTAAPATPCSIRMFTTICSASNVPYSENFDTTAVGSSTNTNAPTCWKYLEPTGWAGYGYVSTTAFTSSPNGYYIYTDTATTGGGMLVSPQTTNLTNGNNRVRFSANGGGSGYTMEVGTLSDPNDAATFVAIGSPISLTTTMSPYIVNIPAGTNQYLAFRHNGGGTYRSVRLDDINVEVIPSCVEPTSIVASNITSSGATIAWTAPATAPANGYEYYYSTTNTAPTATTAASGTSTTTSTPVSGLAANTTYYIWVRSVCTTSTKSAWSLMATFTTACNSYVPSYTNDFSTFPGACWTLANGGTPSTGPGTGTTNYWVEDGFLNNTSTGAARINLYSTGRAGWLISPVFNLTAGGYQVKFNYGITTYSGTGTSAMGSDDIVNVLMSTDNGVTWTIIQTWNAANAPSNTNNTFTYNIASTSNQVKFAVFGSDGTVGDTPDYNFYVDNFIVETAPTCLEPTAIIASNITAAGATISWTAPATAPANGYEYYYSTVNTAPTATTTISGTSATVSTPLSGLAAATTYYVWVRSVCSTTDKSVWSSNGTFTTSCVDITSLNENFDTTSSTGNILPNCWSKLVTGTSSNAYVQASTVMSAPNNLYIYGNSATEPVIVKLPSITNLSTGNYAIKFKGRANYTAGGKIDVGYMTDPANASTFVTLGTYTTTSNTVIDDYYLAITGVPAGVTTLALRNAGSPAYSVLIDDLMYDLASSLGTSNVASPSKENIQVYPNPFADVLNISDISNVKSISVVDISGKLVKTFDKPESTLHLRELNSGMYLVILNMKDGSKQTIKAIKK